MKQEIKIPSMGESISEATVGTIMKPSGSLVKMDEEILELETDKVNQVLYAPQAGVLTLTVKTDEVVKIGQIIGTVEEKSSSKDVPTPSSPKTSEASPSLSKEKPSPSTPVVSFSPLERKERSIRKSKEEEVKDLLMKESSSPTSSDSSSRFPEPSPSQKGERKETRQRMSKIRKIIGERLLEAQRTTAMLTTFNEVDMSAIIGLRAKYKEVFAKEHQAKLGFMSFFVKATVSALQAYPMVNAYIEGEEMVYREYYDIGIAVGMERGLIVPVLRDADTLTFAGIEKMIEEFATKARNGTLSADALQGGSFTITNGGIYGSLLSTPMLTPKQSGILGMHKIEKRAVVVEEEIVIRPMMYLALSYDHRVIDGKEAVAFLVHIKECLEEPARLLLEV